MESECRASSEEGKNGVSQGVRSGLVGGEHWAFLWGVGRTQSGGFCEGRGNDRSVEWGCA